MRPFPRLRSIGKYTSEMSDYYKSPFIQPHKIPTEEMDYRTWRHDNSTLSEAVAAKRAAIKVYATKFTGLPGLADFVMHPAKLARQLKIKEPNPKANFRSIMGRKYERLEWDKYSDKRPESALTTNMNHYRLV